MHLPKVNAMRLLFGKSESRKSLVPRAVWIIIVLRPRHRMPPGLWVVFHPWMFSIAWYCLHVSWFVQNYIKMLVNLRMWCSCSCCLGIWSNEPNLTRWWGISQQNAPHLTQWVFLMLSCLTIFSGEKLFWYIYIYYIYIYISCQIPFPGWNKSLQDCFGKTRWPLWNSCRTSVVECQYIFRKQGKSLFHDYHHHWLLS